MIEFVSTAIAVLGFSFVLLISIMFVAWLAVGFEEHNGKCVYCNEKAEKGEAVCENCKKKQTIETEQI